MNYGRKGAQKREAELTSKITMIRHKFQILLLKALLVCFFALIVIGSTSALGIFKGVIATAPAIDALDVTPTGYQSVVYDANGKKLTALVATGSNRKYVPLNEIPLNLQHAFIAIEDERFYTHNGIDLQGIARAAKVVISTRKLSQGGSTITQQLLKNTVLSEVWATESNDIEKIQRKLQEQYLALELEKKVSKDWILENYLNAINLGQNTLGVSVASERYFGKQVSELNLSECAVLAAITQNPYKYNPITKPEKNAERRQRVLDNMLEQEFISKKEYDEAVADDVYSRIQVVNIESVEKSINSYFVDELTDQLAQDLIEQKGYTENQAYKAIYQGGLSIYATQDSAIQAICDEEVNNLEHYPTDPKISFYYRVSIQSADGSVHTYTDQTMLAYYRDRDNKYSLNFDSEESAQAAIDQYKETIMEEGDTIVENSETVTFTLQPQVALSVIDQSTGEVKAIVGGRGDKRASKTYNRATNSTRQPGSTFKIVACYAAALDAGGKTLASVQDDAPFSYSGENGKEVTNYDSRYRGFTSLREAITNSINIVTVKTFTEIGPRLGYDYVCKLGITTVNQNEQDNQSLCLGGLTNGVTNLELTGAYATIANKGVYIKPKFYTKVLDHDGKVLIDNTTPESSSVLKESTAWLLTDAMKDVMTAGTGKVAYFGSSMAQAGKSGTTTSNKDALFAGFTPYYTCVVWGGYDDSSAQIGTQTSYPKKIWKAVMTRLHEDLEFKDFEKPDSIVPVAICCESGKLPIEGVCDADPRGSRIRTEFFAAGTEPTEYCDHHTIATICSASGMQAGPFCPLSGVYSGVFVIGGSPETEEAPFLLLLPGMTGTDAESEEGAETGAETTPEPPVPQICWMHNGQNSEPNNVIDQNPPNQNPPAANGE